jgi:hypothetical protein
MRCRSIAATHGSLEDAKKQLYQYFHSLTVVGRRVDLGSEQLILEERQEFISPSERGSCCLSTHLHENPELAIGSTNFPREIRHRQHILQHTPPKQRTENIKTSKDGKIRSLKSVDIPFGSNFLF